ncbi:hypothetical protein OUZ56_032317 [Daphnia magna]|uniref:DAGKc domain-containing protein n=1 Tax=Daphnia magna TaxID=35525 RepID=A0ABR0B8K5_9CRUS|nr:hypothetical protein OUZ56_032317 [Daphnia magna]
MPAGGERVANDRLRALYERKGTDPVVIEERHPERADGVCASENLGAGRQRDRIAGARRNDDGASARLATVLKHVEDFLAEVTALVKSDTDRIEGGFMGEQLAVEINANSRQKCIETEPREGLFGARDTSANASARPTATVAGISARHHAGEVAGHEAVQPGRSPKEVPATSVPVARPANAVEMAVVIDRDRVPGYRPLPCGDPWKTWTHRTHCQSAKPGNRKDPSLFRRLATIAGANALPRFVGSQEELDAAAQEFKEAGVDLVAVAGGDGTNGRVIGALRGPYGDASMPTIAFLRGGTMNTVANGIGVARRSSRGAPSARRRRPRPAFDAEDEPSGQPSIFPGSLQNRSKAAAAALGPRSPLGNGRLGFLAGTGAVYNFLRTYYRTEDPTALTGADVLVRSALGTVFPRFAATTQEVTAGWNGAVAFGEGDLWESQRWLSVLVGTVPQIGLGFRPFPLALARRDRFHVIGIHGDAAALAGALPRIRLGLRFGPTVARDGYTREAIFRSDAHETGFMLDGDLLDHDGPVTVMLGPEVPLAI